MPLRLDPLSRLVGFSFGTSKIAVIYTYGGRPNAFIPPQVIVSVTAPIPMTLVDAGAIQDARGEPGGGPVIGDDITPAMLQHYRAWRLQSVDVYSAGHADHVGIHSAMVLNLAKFVGSTLNVAVTCASLGGNFSEPDVVLSTLRGATFITLLSEGSGNAVVDGDLAGRAVATPEAPGSLNGSIDLNTLAVTLA